MEEKNKKNLKTFGWASFLNDFGSDIIFPLWPIFLSSVMGANMAVIGLIDGLGDAIVSISQAVSGYYSDKIGKRKPFIWIGYIFAGLSRIGYALAPTWHFIIPFRVLDRAGKMRGAPRDAIIADMSTSENRGRNFGYLRMMDNLGAVCGVLFTIFFFSHLGYRNLFLIAAVPSLIGSALIFRKIQETKRGEKQIGRKAFKGLSFRDFDKNTTIFFILSSVFALSSFSYSFLLIFANRDGFSVVAVPVLYLIYSAVASATSLFFGKLADKTSRKMVLGISFVFWLLVCLFFIFFHNHTAMVIAFILYGLHLGALEPVQKALVSELAPAHLRASTLGAFQMVVGLVALPSSVIAGFLWGSIGPSAPFYFSALLTCIALCTLFFVNEKKI